jgi:hypothetical protein
MPTSLFSLTKNHVGSFSLNNCEVEQSLCGSIVSFFNPPRSGLLSVLQAIPQPRLSHQDFVSGPAVTRLLWCLDKIFAAVIGWSR